MRQKTAKKVEELIEPRKEERKKEKQVSNR